MASGRCWNGFQQEQLVRYAAPPSDLAQLAEAAAHVQVQVGSRLADGGGDLPVHLVKQKLVADLEIYGAGKQGPGGSEEAAAPPEGELPAPPPATEQTEAAPAE